MRVTQRRTPVPTSYRQNRELGNDNCSANSSSYFLRGLNTKTNMAFRITDYNNSLKSCTLARARLLLNGLDLNARRYDSAKISIVLEIYLQHSVAHTYLHNFIL